MSNTLGIRSRNSSSQRLPSSFYFILLARFGLFYAVSAQAILMGWQLYEWTNSPLALGKMGLFEAIPALFLMFVSGSLIDRGNPKRIYQAVICVSACSIGIALLAKEPSQLFLAGILTGTMRAFSGPSMQVLIPRILKPEQIQAGSALSTGIAKSASVLGAMVAGTILAYGGTKPAYFVCLAFSGVSLLSLSIVPYRHPVKSRPTLKPSLIQEIKDGIGFVFSTRALLSCMMLDMFAVLFGGVNALFPVFAKDILKMGPSGVGLLSGSFAVGSVLTSLTLARFNMVVNPGRKLLLAVIGFGVCTLGFGASTNMYLSLTLLFLAGGLDAVSMVIRGALVQLFSPDHMRGRVAAINQFFIGSSNEIGAFESGVAAHLMGVVPSVLFGGSMTLLTALVVLKIHPGLLKLQFPTNQKAKG